MANPKEKFKYYELMMPCYYPAEDMQFFLDKTDNDPDAFLKLSKLYQDASNLCRRLAGIALETPGVEVYTTASSIEIYGPTSRLDCLVDEEILLPLKDDSEEESEND